MTQQDPKQTIVEALSHPSSLYIKVLQKEGLIAKATTIQFLKQHSTPRYQLHAVTFENEAGVQRTCFCFVRRGESDLWELSHTLDESGEHPPTKEEQDTNQPWVQLGAHVGVAGTLFWAAGHVIDHGFDVTRVRLISSNGLVLEDRIEDGPVLFLTDQQVQLPVEAELYNRFDALVGKQTVFRALP